MVLNRPHRGFSLLELVAALTIGAILVGFAAPAFGQLQRIARLTASVDEMLGALFLAHLAALERNVPTALCLTSAAGQCLDRAGTPANGWLVFYDHRRESPVRLSVEDEIIRRGTVPAGVLVQGTRPAVTYWPASRSGTTATFDFCSSDETRLTRAIVVSQTGRPRITDIGSLSCPQ